MRTKIDWAELHAPLFLAGTNLGQKIPKAEHKNHIHMEYDEEKRHLYVTYNKKTCRIPETSVLSMVEPPMDSPIGEIRVFRGEVPTYIPSEAHPGLEPLPQAAPPQVETPMSHVHAGPGKGQSGRGGRIK